MYFCQIFFFFYPKLKFIIEDNIAQKMKIKY